MNVVRDDGTVTMRSGVVLMFFMVVLLFQLSMIKYVFGLTGIASMVNALMLLGLSILGIKNVVSGAFSMDVWKGYLLPGALVFGGFFLNISLNLISNVGVAGYLGLMIPWAAYLSVPFFIRTVADTEMIWRFFYRFMLIVSAIGLMEYVLIFNNILPLRVIETPFGSFLTGGVSIFLMPEYGIPHPRMHDVFPEPGTYAMYLLLVIMYALVNKKYFGLAIFAVAFVLSDSLGGYISLILLLLLYAFVRVRRTRFSIGVSMIPLLFMAVGLIGFVAPYLSETYSTKGESADVREKNFSDAIEELPSLLVNQPLGMTLAADTMSNTSDEMYLGSNFAPGTAYTIGGDLAFLGYSLVVMCSLFVALTSFKKGGVSFDQQVVFPTLIAVMPFVFQRATVMDSAAFAFLFAPSIIRYLQSVREAGQINDRV